MFYNSLEVLILKIKNKYKKAYFIVFSNKMLFKKIFYTITPRVKGITSPLRNKFG
jgi:hypothetical protein